LGAINDILASFTSPSPIALSWGVAHDGSNLYITDPLEHPTTIFKVSPTGTNLGTITVNNGQDWIGDMACDGTYLYVCLVGGSNNILKIDKETGLVVQEISGVWNSTSQRGLAYDKTRNELYIGGWNSNMIWRVSAATGAVISSFPFMSVSGLAWHPYGGPNRQGSLWVVTSSGDDFVSEIDPNNGWGTIKSISFPGTGSYAGAGVEMDRSGALWFVNQNDKKLYLVDVAEPYAVPVSTWTIIASFVLIFTFAAIKFKNIL